MSPPNSTGNSPAGGVSLPKPARLAKPQTTHNHEPYSKRAMALDQVRLMAQLGFRQFFVAGHDRGGRVAYRLALDHPQQVVKLAVLDIVPTYEMWRRADMEFGLAMWHWFFLAQESPFPERVIAADPDAFYFRWRPRRVRSRSSG